MHDSNPYAPPATNPLLERPAEYPPVEVRRSCLVLASGMQLPQRCIKTNRPAAPSELIEERFRYAVPWMLSPKYCTVKFFVSADKQQELRRKRLSGVILVLTGIAIQVFGLFSMIGGLSSSGAVLAILGVLVLLTATKYSYLRVVRYRDGRYWLTGFCRKFLAECEATKE